eukprot:NODE_1887_length_1042_cov_516.022290.p1 GENE.NODE_1887_length_1042_cov_516.022290~~NODE_1887_length_1042_cov_516.022290.p1  ORF type:complete len:254 (-),score=84.75 NODE_1887_length_1042_cov_516.022290:263-1024(-)
MGAQGVLLKPSWLEGSWFQGDESQPESAARARARSEMPKADALYHLGLAKLHWEGDAREAYKHFCAAVRADPANEAFRLKCEATFELVRRREDALSVPLRDRAPAPPLLRASEPVLEEWEEEHAGLANFVNLQPRLLRGVFGYLGGTLTPQLEEEEGEETSRKLLPMTFGSWIVVWFMVVYHYRFNRASPQFSWTTIALGTLVVLFSCGILWVGVHSRQAHQLSLSDVTKMSCGAVIAAATVYHYTMDMSICA